MSATVELIDEYHRVRAFTRELIATLAAEDCIIQSMPDVSPTRWHLAHTTWFFETFVLTRDPHYRAYDPRFAYLFNSYYNAIGEQFPRSKRGLLSRPTVQEVWRYREFVDVNMQQRLTSIWRDDRETRDLVQLGLQHEQQHQELMLTDIKHVFSCNPLEPVFRESITNNDAEAVALVDSAWRAIEGGLIEIGHAGQDFAFDNESPRHRVFLEPFELQDRLVTSGEFMEFIDAGGYRRPEYWLSLGWQVAERERWEAPLYWTKRASQWHEFTLTGMRPVDRTAPVCHVSYFEADAFARWAGARLPTEAEWEHAAGDDCQRGNFADSLLARQAALHPSALSQTLSDGRQMYGDVWEWTSSSYAPYPRFRPSTGAIGEYNGKFMCNQYVLRGGSCATSSSHIRRTYRNFFPPECRWQFSGIRLCRD